MKTIKRLTLSTIALLLCSFMVQAQSTYKVSHDLNFEDESNTEEIIIEVKGKKSYLSIDASCNVKFGDVSIEIYDPNGVKQKHFSIGSKVRPKAPTKEKKTKEYKKQKLQKELQARANYGIATEAYSKESAFFYNVQYSGGVQGKVREKVKSPAEGKWVVKIIPKNATASISVRAYQKN